MRQTTPRLIESCQSILMLPSLTTFDYVAISRATD